jgi:hypothetical protein
VPNSSIPPCPQHFPAAERDTWHIGSAEDRRWRSVKFPKLPLSFQAAVASTYIRIYLAENLQQANLYLLEVTDRFDTFSAKLISEPDELNDFARVKAKACARICDTRASAEKAYQRISKSIKRIGISPPIVERNTTLEGALNRLSAEKWWRMQLHRYCLEVLEHSAILCGLTHSKAGLYISDESLQIVISKRIRNQDILNSLIAINELGEEHALSELVSGSISNPENRRNELMARLFGFDVIAKKLDHDGLFVTLTCPSRMHARFKASGDRNPKFDSSSPRESQKYLCKLWSRIRAAFNNKGIQIYGFRVAEPQHDATPHWHILLYSRSENIAQIKQTFTKYALADTPEERGAEKNRVTFIDIDWAKGSGVGYIAKYISKNIDGAHLDKDLEGNSAEASAKRVSAWASVHGIRQFQQLGGPTVTSWRELRRIAEAPEGLLSEAREAADSGNWELFTEALGGIDCPRKEQALKLLHIHDDEPGIYGEPKGDSILGVTDGKQYVVTREHSWTIEKAAKAPCLPNAVR